LYKINDSEGKMIQEDWQHKAFIFLDLGDRRRNKRAIKMAQKIEHKSETRGASSILGSAAEVKAASRLMNCPDITPKSFAEGFIQAACEEITGEHVLVIQDTTELNFAWRKKEIPGLGPVGNGIDQGFFLHPGILVDPERDRVLGLASAEFYTREYGETTTANGAHKNRPYEEKESYRWLQTPLGISKKIPEAVRMTVVADREADIYNLFLSHQKGELGDNCELLIRAAHNRKIDDGKGYLFDDIAGWHVRGNHRIVVPRKKGEPEREAELAVRFGSITMEVPKTQRHIDGREQVMGLQVVDVHEVGTPEGKTPVHWTLITTWLVDTIESALEKVEWYRYRWYIEELFRILKSGYQVESVRFESGHALMNWCAFRLMMAIRVLCMLTCRGDEQPDGACGVFTDVELEVLRACESELIPKKSTIHRPAQYTMAWATLLIAIFGGYKVTPSAKPFGQQTLWRGLARLEGAVVGYCAAIRAMKCG
jgi:hypothetical protein